MHRTFILIVLFVGGCSAPLPPAADSGQARSALQTALDAWQKGETPQSLQSRSPAIHVNDPGWSSGEQLIKYEILSEQSHGQSWNCQVLLTVQVRGAAAQQQADYVIDTKPAIVVVRSLE